MIDGEQFAQCAYAFCGLGIKYSTLDCQGFIERVLLACGVKCNYLGSNDMFRNMCTFYEVPMYTYGTKEDLGHSMGKEFRASLAVTDEGFAKSIEKRLKEAERIAEVAE